MTSTDQPRLTTADFDPQVLILYDAYVHGDIDRRGFLRRAGQILGGAAALAALDALNPRFAWAQQVAKDDPRLTLEYRTFESPKGYGQGRGYLARPAKQDGPLPLVIVVHENRGLNPHIEDVARRLALENYVAFAPDALTPLGGYPGSEDEARAKFATLDQSKCREDFLAAAAFARSLDGLNGRTGTVGFCYGGAIVNFLATELDGLHAAAPFYGGAPPIDKVAGIRADTLIVLAENDERVNAAWPAYQAALDAAKVRYELLQPPGTTHGFHNDTTPRYAEAAAKQAWTKLLALFERSLRVTAS